ncbi:MAG: hypothetical protein R6U68_16535 [Desulfobacteraceae bacterium]
MKQLTLFPLQMPCPGALKPGDSFHGVVMDRAFWETAFLCFIIYVSRGWFVKVKE